MQKKILNRPSIVCLICCILFSAPSVAQSFRVTNNIGFDITEGPRIPLSIGYTLTNSMDDHTHVDKVCRKTFRINNENLHEQLIYSAAASVFQNATKIAIGEDTLLPQVDAILVFSPAVLEKGWWQSSYPCSTGNPIYEIFFRYNITLISLDGTQLAQWITTAYGSAKEEDVPSISQGIKAASNEAFTWMRGQVFSSFTSEPARAAITALYNRKMSALELERERSPATPN